MYIIEGNIGAGKTTFLKLIGEFLPEVTVKFEPVDSWKNQVYGQSLLSNFYSDTKRWAYTMEIFAMMSRVQDYIKEQEQKDKLILLERSIYSGHYCFAKNGYNNGFFTNLEWEIYLQWFNFLVKNNCNPPRGFIYLKINPEIAFERIKKRNRSGESNIEFKYLQQLDKCHEEFLIKKADLMPELQNIPVLELDCNTDFENNINIFIDHAKAVKNFISL